MTSPRTAAPALPSRSAFTAALAATALLVVGAAGALAATDRYLADRAARLAPLNVEWTWRGEAAQSAIFRQSDLLPVYGSSELVIPMGNRAQEVFAHYPTGFAVAPIGDNGFPPLSMALALGSLGDDLRGKRLVLSLSGTWFVGDDTRNDSKTFRFHYSELQLGDVLWSSDLPTELKRRLARRVLGYLDLQAVDPLVGTALTCLAAECAVGPLLLALRPLWWLRRLPLRLNDRVHLLWALRASSEPERRAESIDFDGLAARGDSAWRLKSANNRMGIEDTAYQHWQADITKIGLTPKDGRFLRLSAKAPKWEELELLLATVRARGARAFVLASPLKGAWWDTIGVSRAARDSLYARLQRSATASGTVMRGFHEFDADPFFLSEPRSHPSPKGWAEYDRVLNAFFHDSIR